MHLFPHLQPSTACKINCKRKLTKPIALLAILIKTMRNRITGISKRVLGQHGTKLEKKLRRKEASAKQRLKTTVHYFIYLVIMICLPFLLTLRYQDMTQQFTQHFKLINSKNPRNVNISRNDTPIDTTFQVDQLKQFKSINSKNPSDKTYARWSATSKIQFDEKPNICMETNNK